MSLNSEEIKKFLCLCWFKNSTLIHLSFTFDCLSNQLLDPLSLSLSPPLCIYLTKLVPHSTIHFQFLPSLHTTLFALIPSAHFLLSYNIPSLRLIKFILHPFILNNRLNDPDVGKGTSCLRLKVHSLSSSSLSLSLTIF